MPRPRADAVRRAELIAAALAAIHDRGAADVTVADVARRAGVSTALAHHYFGSKDALMLATMRSLLRDYRSAVSAALRGARHGRGRVEAIIAASLGPAQFRPEGVSGWLAFFSTARRDPRVGRLARVYFLRLRSNLAHALRPLAGREAPELAEALAAMIDGFYLRHGLAAGGADPRAASAAALAWLDRRLAA